MEFTEYQKKAWETAVYPNKGNNISYAAIALGGESGEVLDKIKKILRDHGAQINEEKKQEIVKELGDVLWTVAALATELKVDLNDVAEKNVKKITDRQTREVV
ncbi:MAG: nucleoside triphosphate pyrophosphohydrolase family protein, partial [Nanoarchaeota archaeon]|nr:nucleoside triphosphate pyrophosphohydrolase family protein [Nanoarchaeota archaeon]